jgi:hypothetical protein
MIDSLSAHRAGRPVRLYILSQISSLRYFFVGGFRTKYHTSEPLFSTSFSLRCRSNCVETDHQDDFDDHKTCNIVSLMSVIRPVISSNPCTLHQNRAQAKSFRVAHSNCPMSTSPNLESQNFIITCGLDMKLII